MGYRPWPPVAKVGLREQARLVEKFIQALDLREITLLGHDSSGSVGLSVAVKQPERFKAFIITDTFAWPLTDYPKVVRMLKFVSGPIFGFLARHFNLMTWAVILGGARTRRLSKTERQAYLKAFPTPAARQRVLTLFRELYTQTDFMAALEQGLEERFKDHPALLIYTVQSIAGSLPRIGLNVILVAPLKKLQFIKLYLMGLPLTQRPVRRDE